MENLIHQSFWGVAVTPNEVVTLEPLDNRYTVITGAVLADYDQSNINQTSILSGTVHTTVIDKIVPTESFDPESVVQTNFAYLIPEKAEHVKMNHLFSPLSKVELKISGPHTVYVSGKYLPVDLDDEEEEDITDLDDSDENLNEDELKQKLKNKYIQEPKDDSDNNDDE
ncbi:hypothetical protein M9Y10_011630 [Tritrichomonas musculus]|uniref:Nucleoplasmin-like domain-containing protein n=1 Tax=Tritrichomonas musculus TaxID=1915356 RepID=A0ABR2GMX7_9EUKA